MQEYTPPLIVLGHCHPRVANFLHSKCSPWNGLFFCLSVRINIPYSQETFGAHNIGNLGWEWPLSISSNGTPGFFFPIFWLTPGHKYPRKLEFSANFLEFWAKFWAFFELFEEKLDGFEKNLDILGRFWEILLEFWPNFLEFGQNIEFLAPWVL